MEAPKLPNNISPGIFDLFIYKLIEVKDNQVLYRGNPIIDKKNKTVPIDAPSFKSLGFGYFVDKNSVYGLTLIIKSNSEKFYLTPIPKVDRDSFQAINKFYAKDKNNIYFAGDGKVIKSGDARPLNKKIMNESNQIEPFTTAEKWRTEFILTKSHVYYRGKIVKEAKPESFCKMGNYWLKDVENVFSKNGYQITLHKEFHAPSFIAFGVMNGTDKFQGVETLFSSASPEALAGSKRYQNFFENQNHLSDYWYFKAKEKIATLQTQEIVNLGEGYFNIANEIYYKARKKDKNLTSILGTNTNNFKLLAHGYATNGIELLLLRDESWSYHKKLRQVKINTKNPLEIISDAWVYDGVHFYYKGFKKFKGDRKTFTVLNHIYAYDRHGLFCQGVRKKDVKISKNIRALGGVYLKIDDTFYYLGKSRKDRKIDDSSIKLINDFIIMGEDGSAFNHGKFRKYIGDFEKFNEISPGLWSDGERTWKIGYAGLEVF